MNATHSLAGWMVYALCLAALTSVVAAAAEEPLRRSGRSVRSLWGASLVAGVVLPLLASGLARAPALASSTSEVASASSQRISTTSAEVASLEGGPPSETGTVWGSLPRWSLSAVRIPSLARFDTAARVIAIVSPLAYLAWLLLAWMSLRARRRGWREGTFDDVAVLLSPDFGPAIVGVRRPRIVIPLWAVELPPGERRLLLAHEQAHLAARDERGLTAALCSLAIMPWNLALWHQLRRYRLAVELDCDARVLSAERDVRRYGELLLKVARRAPVGSTMVAALVERPSALRRRIEAMTTRGARTPLRRLMRDGSVVALAVVVACTIAPPTGSQSPLPDRALYRLDVTSVPVAPRSITAASRRRGAAHAESLAGVAPGTSTLDARRRGIDSSARSEMDAARPLGGEGIRDDSAPSTPAIETVAAPSAAAVSIPEQPVPGPDATADILRGRVMGPDSQPVEGALVVAKNHVTGMVATTRTRPDGRYSLVFADGNGDYLMTFVAPGFHERAMPLRREADEAVLVLNVTLGGATGPTDCPSPRGARPIEIFMPPTTRPELLAGARVTIDFFVNEKGGVDSLHFVPTADPGYNDRLRSTLGGYRFTPGVSADGTPLAMRCTLTYDLGR